MAINSWHAIQNSQKQIDTKYCFNTVAICWLKEKFQFRL